MDTLACLVLVPVITAGYAGTGSMGCTSDKDSMLADTVVVVSMWEKSGGLPGMSPPTFSVTFQGPRSQVSPAAILLPQKDRWWKREP